MQKVIGVDIGGTHVKSAAVDLDAEEVLENTIINLKLDRHEDADTIFNVWAKAINHSIEQSQSAIAGIEFAMPGPFNYQQGVALFKGDNDKYEHLYNLSIDNHLRPLLNIDADVPIRFHNDATCFAIGEAKIGEARDVKRSISITLGTGFGAAFIDQLVPVVNDHNVPENGSLWHLPFRDGVADEYFSSRWFINEYQKRTGSTLPGVKEILEMTDQTTIDELFNDFGEMVADFLTPWIKKFEAEMVVFGGNISETFHLFSDTIDEHLIRNTIKCRICKSMLKDLSAIYGSAMLLDEQFYDQVKNDLPLN